MFLSSSCVHPRLQYINYKARNVALPWELSHGDIDEAKREAIISGISARSGLSKEQLSGGPKA
jgi:hypothetical protein